MTAFRARGQPSWPESDSPFGDNGRGFGQHQACTADRAATEMHEVPVVCKSRSHWNTGTSAKRRFDSARSHHEVRGSRRARRPPVPRTRRPRARRPGGPRRSGAAFDVLSRRADASCRFTQQGGRVPRCTGSRHAAEPDHRQHRADDAAGRNPASQPGDFPSRHPDRRSVSTVDRKPSPDRSPNTAVRREAMG